MPSEPKRSSQRPGHANVGTSSAGAATPRARTSGFIIGLGTAGKIDKVDIYWPSGKKEEVIVPGVDRILTVVEGQGVVEK